LVLLAVSVWAWLRAEPRSMVAFAAFIGIVLGGVWFSARFFQGVFGRLTFPLRVLKTLTGLGRERQALYQAAFGIHRRQEERAFALLEVLVARGAPDVRASARWLRALAAVSWLRRHQRALSDYRERFPQLHLLLFGPGAQDPALHSTRLHLELAEVSSRELDALAGDYLVLTQRLVAELSDSAAPFHAEAEQLLEFLTGEACLLRPAAHYAAWWQRFHPVFRRGGGALLTGLRLVERGYYEDAARLLERLQHGGLLSAETEGLRRIAAFLSLLGRSPWRLSSQEIPRLFQDLHYCAWPETGLLRLPLATRPELVAWCRRGRELRAAKQEFIETTLHLWSLFGRRLDGPLSVLLARLIVRPGRRVPRSRAAWRRYWAAHGKEFEPAVVLLMDGIVALASQQRAEALRCFERAALLDAEDPTPLINQVYVLALDGQAEAAHGKTFDILQRFPRDAGGCLALGQIYALRLDDHATAESLFQRAHELEPGSADPLLLLGELALARGRYGGAEQAFDLALRTDPGALEARLGLARLYMETRRYKLAEEHLLRAAKDGRGDLQHQAHYLLYRVYRELDEDRRAIEYLDKIPTQYFTEPDELDDIAFHLEAEQQYAKARAYAERAMLLRARGHGPDEHGDAASLF
jgi:tetratricopeptide (TPR) repeat protein